MKCICCLEEKEPYIFKLTNSDTGFIHNIELNHDLCKDCFDPKNFRGLSNINKILYDTKDLAKKRQDNYCHKVLGLSREDLLSYQEIWLIFREKGVLSSNTICPKERQKQVKDKLDGRKIEQLFIPQGDVLGETQLSVYRKEEIIKFCESHIVVTWHGNSKHKLTPEQMDCLLSIGYLKYKDGEPLFGKNLKTLEKPCLHCGEIKSPDHFMIIKGGTVWRCNACTAKHSFQYYNDNKESCLIKIRAWNKENKEKRNEYNKQPHIKAHRNIRKRLGKFLKEEPDKFSKTIGCTQKELKLYLESQFTEGMSWDNYGSGENFDHKGCWNIDHRIPISRWNEFKHLLSPEEQISPNYYLNLQPMWSSENFSKSNKYTHPVSPEEVPKTP